MEVIDIGSGADDGTGDPLRTAFDKCNTNFAFSGVLLKKASNLGGDFTSNTQPEWDTEVYDVGGWHDNAVNPSRITVPSGVNYLDLRSGLYLIDFSGDLSTIMYFWKNGATLSPVTPLVRGDSAGGQWGAEISIVIPVVAGDYFEVNFLVETDTTTTINATASFFSAMKVG